MAVKKNGKIKHNKNMYYVPVSNIIPTELSYKKGKKTVKSLAYGLVPVYKTKADLLLELGLDFDEKAVVVVKAIDKCE